MSWLKNIYGKIFRKESLPHSCEPSKPQSFEKGQTSTGAQNQDNIKRINALSSVLSKEYPRGDRAVYVYRDAKGDIFYVGIDVGRETFSTNPPAYVRQYCSETLGNLYTVEHLIKSISSDSAGFVKDRILEFYSESLINTQNTYRAFNMEIFNQYERNMADYKKYMETGILFEKVDIVKAIEAFEMAYDSYIKAMNSRNFDGNELYLASHPPISPSKLVDRISLCLKKTKQHEKLIDFSERYVLYFKRSERTSGEKNLLSRVEDARKNLLAMQKS